MFLIVNNERTPDAQNQSVAPLVGALRDLHCDYEIMPAGAVMPPGGFERFVGVVLSDGRLAPREELTLSGFRLDLQVLLEVSVPILGIGTGGRLIAEAYGALVKHREPFEAYEATVELMSQSVLFDYLSEAIRVKDDRPDFIAEIPAQFEVVASSKRCPAHALQHRTKELYAVYFSVAAAGEDGTTIAKNFLRYAGTAGGVL